MWSQSDARMTISQVAAGDKERQITAVRSLLCLMDLTGAQVTGDALHCPRETARLIEEKGRDWLFTLKPNCPAQQAEVSARFSRPDAARTTTEPNDGHIEVRRHAVSHDVGWMLSDRRDPARRQCRASPCSRQP